MLMEMAGSRSCPGSAFHEDGLDEQNTRGPSVEVDASRLSKSLKAIGTDTDRSATYDFLLLIPVIMGLSRTVSEINGNFGRKSII